MYTRTLKSCASYGNDYAYVSVPVSLAGSKASHVGGTQKTGQTLHIQLSSLPRGA